VTGGWRSRAGHRRLVLVAAQAQVGLDLDVADGQAQPLGLDEQQSLVDERIEQSALDPVHLVP
jgi:hypothetical protein